MNVSLSFNNIISACLFDIKTEIDNCQIQLDITTQKIEELESLQQKNNINQLKESIQKINLLLVDNYCLISKQSTLIKSK